MSEPITLRIRTIDGEDHEFEFPTEQVEGTDYTITSRIEKLLSQRSIALALEDRLLIIPMEQIRAIEVSPILGKLPGVVPQVKPIWSSLATCGPDEDDPVGDMTAVVKRCA